MPHLVSYYWVICELLMCGVYVRVGERCWSVCGRSGWERSYLSTRLWLCLRGQLIWEVVCFISVCGWNASHNSYSWSLRYQGLHVYTDLRVCGQHLWPVSATLLQKVKNKNSLVLNFTTVCCWQQDRFFSAPASDSFIDSDWWSIIQTESFRCVQCLS